MSKKTTTLLLSRYVPGILFLLIISCDPFQEDLISPDKQLTINTSATDYYVLPGSTTVIDLRSIVGSSFTAALKVSENPKRGKLTSIGDLLLKYKTYQNFTERSDHLHVRRC